MRQVFSDRDIPGEKRRGTAERTTIETGDLMARSRRRRKEIGGPKPTHRLAPAVRQDTKNRLWRPKESETTNDTEAGSRQATAGEGVKEKNTRKEEKRKKEKRKRNKKRNRGKKREKRKARREKGINGKAPGKVSDRPEGASAGGAARELQYHYRIQRQDIGIDQFGGRRQEEEGGDKVTRGEIRGD